MKMASLRIVCGRSPSLLATHCVRLCFAKVFSAASGSETTDVVTHTGQKFEPDDYRNVRFLVGPKLVNTNFAIDLVHEDPVVVCTQRVVASDSGGPLGHPRVYINLDPPGMHTCGYSGRRFVLKKHYDEKTMGLCVTYEQYCEEIGREED